MGQLDTKAIISPRLNIPGYGKGVDDAFKAIEENFRIVANRDFVKGDRGYSVCTKVYPLVINIDPEKEIPEKKDLYLTDVGVYTINAILKNITASTDDSLTGVYQKYIKVDHPSESPTGNFNLQEVVDAIDNSDQSELSWAKTLNKDSQDSYTIFDWISPNDKFVTLATYDPSAAVKTYNVVASLNTYVFKDKRFNHDSITTDIVRYSGKEDASCTIYIQASETTVTTETTGNNPSITNFEGKFMVLNNLPTLYYDNTLNAFCWKLNGQETGMIAQGPAGSNGISRGIHLFQTETALSEYIYKATHVLYTDDKCRTDWAEVTPENTTDIAAGDGAIVFVRNNDLPSKTIYFTNVISKNKDDEGNVEIKVYCANNNAFLKIAIDDEFEKCMNAISPDSITKSLHVPYQTGSEDRINGYKHTIWSTGGNDKEQLNIGPLYYGKYFKSIDNSNRMYHDKGKLKIFYKDFELGFPEFDDGGKVNNLDYNKLAFKDGVFRVGTGVSGVDSGNVGNDMFTKTGNYFAVKGSDICLGNNDRYKIVGKFVPVTYGGQQYYHYMLSSSGTTGRLTSNPPLYINTNSVMDSINDPGMLVIGWHKDNDNTAQTSLRFDNIGIQATSINNTTNTLHLNRFGGPVDICKSSLIVNEDKINIRRPLRVTSDAEFSQPVTVNNKIITNTGYTTKTTTANDDFISNLTSTSLDFSNPFGPPATISYEADDSGIDILNIGAQNITIAAAGVSEDTQIFDGELNFKGSSANFQCTMFPKVINIGTGSDPFRFKSSRNYTDWDNSTRIWIADWGIGNMYNINIKPYNSQDAQNENVKIPGGTDNEITIVLDNRLPYNTPITIVVHSYGNNANPNENLDNPQYSGQGDIGCDIHFVWEWQTYNRGSSSSGYRSGDMSGWKENGQLLLNKSSSRCFKGVNGCKANKATVTVYRSGNALNILKSSNTSGWVLLSQSIDGQGAGDSDICTDNTRKQ